MADSTSRPWWRDAVCYEVYIRSFADGSGDGVGDVIGIRSRLPYLRELGVDALWITPFYPSPMADGGYDVADHRDVEPRFGTLAEFDALIGEAHGLGLRVIIDIVPNHTSSAHPWFQAALSAPPGSPERDRYIFMPGQGPDGSLPPNDWQSVFGGPAWQRVTGSGAPDGGIDEWYLHLFAPEQPDLNWRNPQVREEFESILRFWLHRGVDGFRIDVADALIKRAGLPNIGDADYNDPTQHEHLPYWDEEEVHEIYRAWRKILDRYPGDRMAVGESWVYAPERLANYVRRDELDHAFNFYYLLSPWKPADLRDAIGRSIAATHKVGAPATWVLSNHDVQRHVTRYANGDPETGRRRARAAALLTLALPGAAYVYQGEELGLPEVLDLPDEVLQDPIWKRSGHTRRGRDGCRVPLPWSGQEPPFGFAADAAANPWLPQPAEWRELTAEAQQDDPTSMLALYRAALRLRRDHAALGDGEMRWLRTAEEVLAFARDPGFVCTVNLGTDPVELEPYGELILASGPVPGTTLPPDTAAWWSSAEPG